MFKFGESIDKINMSKADFDMAINEAMARVQYSELDTQSKSDKLTNYIGVIPGQPSFTLSVYDTGKGLTITYKTGKNHQLGFDVTLSIISCVSQVVPKTHTFVSITKDIFISFKEFVEDNQYKFENPNNPHGEVVKIILKNGMSVTVTYYPTTKKLKLEGLKSYLWDIVALWFAEQTYGSINDILALVYSEASIKSAKLIFNDGILDNMINKEAGDAYNNEYIINSTEKKWLRTGCMLCNSGISLPEYLPVVSSSIKVVEGLLWKIVSKTCGQASFNGEKTFVQFSGGKLLSNYISIVGSSSTVDYMNKLYAFYRNTRHKYFHNDGVSSSYSSVLTLDDAKKIYKEILNLVRESNNFKERFGVSS